MPKQHILISNVKCVAKYDINYRDDDNLVLVRVISNLYKDWL